MTVSAGTRSRICCQRRALGECCTLLPLTWAGAAAPWCRKLHYPMEIFFYTPLLCERVRVHRGYHPQAARLRARYSQKIRLYTLIDTSLNGCPYHQTVKWLSPNRDKPCRKEVR